MTTYLIAKLSRNGETFYLWQNYNFGYDYTLTDTKCKPCKPLDTYTHIYKSCEEVLKDLMELGYKREVLV